MKSLCIIIFSRNETKSLADTFERVVNLSKKIELRNVIQEVFIVDDGSDEPNQEIVEKYFRSLSSNYSFRLHLKSQEKLGISRTVSDVISEVRSDINLVLPLPGHDMFDTNSLFKLINDSFVEEITIGYRSNLWEERPFLKYISAQTLTLLYKILIFSKIKDAHGLYIIPIDIARKYILPNGGHEILILPLYIALKMGMKVKQIPITLRKGHLADSKKFGRSPKTRLSHIKSSVSILLVILKDKFIINKY